MQICSITPSGADNILKWAIVNKANFKNDIPLQSIINDETYYLVTFSDVNFLEVFRLTQLYRSKIRIISEEKADVPTRPELAIMFPGMYNVGPEDSPRKGALCEAAEFAMSSFIDLVMQMSTDDDIIKTSACRLFLPMLSRKFTVQIPVGFMDLISTVTEDEAKALFTEEYPGTLSQIIENNAHSFHAMLGLGFVKSTSIIRYDKRYDQYIRMTKHFPINTKSENLYKFGLLGFSKFDPIAKSEMYCSMFNPDPNVLGTNLKKLADIRTPLEIDFALQLPIQYMQILQNSFDPEILKISYDSSMTDIIDHGLEYDDFITYDYDQEKTETDEQREKREAHTNKIEAYKVRISEANNITVNIIGEILKSTEDIDVTAAFAMLPSIYTTRAVIRVNVDHGYDYKNHYDPIIRNMFNDMFAIANGITNDIVKSK